MVVAVLLSYNVVGHFLAFGIAAFQIFLHKVLISGGFCREGVEIFETFLQRDCFGEDTSPVDVNHREPKAVRRGFIRYAKCIGRVEVTVQNALFVHFCHKSRKCHAESVVLFDLLLELESFCGSTDIITTQKDMMPPLLDIGQRGGCADAPLEHDVCIVVRSVCLAMSDEGVVEALEDIRLVVSFDNHLLDSKVLQSLDSHSSDAVASIMDDGAEFRKLLRQVSD